MSVLGAPKHGTVSLHSRLKHLGIATDYQLTLILLPAIRHPAFTLGSDPVIEPQHYD